MAQCYMRISLLLRLFWSLLFLVPIFSSRVVPDDDTAYIRLPSSSQVDIAVDHLVDHYVHGDGEVGGFSYDLSSEDFTKVVVSAPRSPPPPPPSPPLPPPPYLIFASSWPRAVCIVTAVCNIIPRIFTIHGLWGTNGPTETCPPVTFDPNVYRDPLKSQLSKYWVNAKAKSVIEYNAISSSLYFWSYEYQKHGGCTNLLQVPYAQKAVDLYIRENITQIAYSNYAFKITNAQPVDTAEFWGKINTGLGAKTVMVCITKNNKQLLQEIRFYIRTSDWKVVDFPNARKCTGANIYFA